MTVGVPLKVGFDVDGVLYPFDQHLRSDLIARHGFSPARLVPATIWNFFEQWEMTVKEFLEACHRSVNDGHLFHVGDPYPGAVDAYRRIRAAGHTSHICTARDFGDDPAAVTRDWLAAHGFEYETIEFSTDKTSVADLVDVFIDDSAENYLDLEADGRCVPVLLTRPWNAWVPGARRVADLAEYAELIGRLSVQRAGRFAA